MKRIEEKKRDLTENNRTVSFCVSACDRAITKPLLVVDLAGKEHRGEDRQEPTDS